MNEQNFKDFLPELHELFLYISVEGVVSTGGTSRISSRVFHGISARDLSEISSRAFPGVDLEIYL